MSAKAELQERENNSIYVSQIGSVDLTSLIRMKTKNEDRLLAAFDKEESLDCLDTPRGSGETNIRRKNLHVVKDKECIPTDSFATAANFEEVSNGKKTISLKNNVGETDIYLDLPNNAGLFLNSMPLPTTESQRMNIRTNNNHPVRHTQGESLCHLSASTSGFSETNIEKKASLPLNSTVKRDNLFGNAFNFSVSKTTDRSKSTSPICHVSNGSHGNNVVSAADSNKANVEQETSFLVHSDESKLPDNHAGSITLTKQENIRTRMSCSTNSTWRKPISYTNGIIIDSCEKATPNRNSSSSKSIKTKKFDDSPVTNNNFNRVVPRKVRVFSIDPNQQTLPGNSTAASTTDCKDGNNGTTTNNSERLFEERCCDSPVVARRFSKPLEIRGRNCLAEHFDVVRSSNSCVASETDYFVCSVSSNSDSKHDSVKKRSNPSLYFHDIESTSSFHSSTAESKELQIGTKTASPVCRYDSVLFDNTAASVTHSKENIMRRKSSSLLNKDKSPNESTIDSRKTFAIETTHEFTEHYDKEETLDSLSITRCKKNIENDGSAVNINDVCVQTPDWTSLKDVKLSRSFETNDRSCSCSSRNRNDTTVAMSYHDYRLKRKPLRIARLKISSLSKCFIISSVEKCAE